MSFNIATILKESTLRHPDRCALISDEGPLSYAQLWDQVTRLAASLKSLGVAPKQHIALMLPNCPAFTIGYFAAHLLGCRVVPLNVMLKKDEIAYHLKDADAALLIASAAYGSEVMPALRASLKCATLIIAASSVTHEAIQDDRTQDDRTQDDRKFQVPDEFSSLRSTHAVHHFHDLVSDAAQWDQIYPSTSDDTAVILYTSGTTGKPKGAELTHLNLLLNAEFIVKLTQALQMDRVICLLALPLFHSFGQTVMQNATLHAGGTVVQMPRFTAKEAAQLVAAHQINFFAGVPTMYYSLLHDPAVSPAHLASLRLCLAGGASLPGEVLRQFDLKYGVDIIEAYGLSETSPVASCNPLGGSKKIGSVGQPIWGVEFRIVAEDGVEVKTLELAGELEIKGHNVMKGYYQRPEETAKALKNGWFATGDVATKDGDGFYRIVDRKKDLIIRGGFNVYPREVEELLYAHPQVRAAAVVGIPHVVHGEEIYGFVVLHPQQECTQDELIHYCKERLAAYKYPRIICFLEQLPLGPTGKILKRVLRDEMQTRSTAAT